MALKEILSSANVLAFATTSPGKAQIRMLQGAQIVFKSWERAENLSGPTIYGLVVDEAHLLTTDAWSILRARLSATGGPIRVIGNAGDSEGIFHDICEKASDPDSEASVSFHRWTWLDKLAALGGLETEEGAAYQSIIEDERRAFIGSPYIFRSLYEAEWTANVNAAISPDAVNAATTIQPAGPESGAEYVIWWDIAQSVDFTVGVPIRVRPAPRAASAMIRVHRMNYPEVADLIVREHRRWNNARTIIEINGPGKPVLDEVIKRGVPAQPFTTESKNKHAAFVALSRDLTSRDLVLAPLPPLQQEIKSLRSIRNKSGTYSWEAPPGRHDDCAMSLAGGNWIAQWADPLTQRAGLMRIS
jgi:hypothetical protein